jgi:hypothetical protein
VEEAAQNPPSKPSLDVMELGTDMIQLAADVERGRELCLRVEGGAVILQGRTGSIEVRKRGAVLRTADTVIYILASEECHVEAFERGPDGWFRAACADAARLPSGTYTAKEFMDLIRLAVKAIAQTALSIAQHA